MSSPQKINFKIYQGATFEEVIRWESYEKGYAPITAITKAAPVEITSVGHGIPSGWRVKIKNVGGMKEINSDEYVTVTETTSSVVTINEINSLSYSTYTSGGVLEFQKPKSLAGITARMQIRAKLSSTDVLHELTTENGGIVINDTLKTITLTIPATVTETFTFKTAVYSLELVSGTTVTAFVYGSITVDPEITR